MLYDVGMEQKEGGAVNPYVTGTMIRRLREGMGLTQQELADRLNVSGKAVSKWETARGYPDVTLLEPLASALGVSLIELFSGADVTNANRAADMLRLRFCVCPVCGNVIQSTGEAVVSCCGLLLPALEAEDAEGSHAIRVERVEDEYYVSLDHEMSRTHYISFLAALRCDGCEIKKLYPEGAAEARFKIAGTEKLLCCCNRHGLFRLSLRGSAGAYGPPSGRR